MLDAQRYRSGTLRREVHFARVVLWVHLGLGILVLLLMLLHEIFGWAAGVAGWYLVSVLVVGGLISGHASCRWFLGIAFLGFALIGAIFLGQVLPELKPDTPPLLSHSLLRVWLGGVNLIYAAGGFLVLRSESIRKATEIGFKLW